MEERKKDPDFPFCNNVVVGEGIGYLKGTSKASSSCCANPCSSKPIIADGPPLCSWPWWGSACLLDPCHPTYQRAQEAGDAGWWGSHPHAAHCHPWEGTDRCPGLGQTPSKEERKIISLSHLQQHMKNKSIQATAPILALPSRVKKEVSACKFPQYK